jgi:transposase
LLALSKGHSPATVSDILGVSIPSPYNWLKAWRNQGLMGILTGHQGGAPQKLTPEQLDTAEQIARASPCNLAEIDRQLRECYPDLPSFSLTSLGRHLKQRGLSFSRTRLSLKKTETPTCLSRPKTH